MYAEVLVQYKVKSLDKTFSYHIPESLEKELKVGMKVKVPFGNQNINGFVVNITDNKKSVDTKDIIDIITKELVLNQELMELGKYIKEKTLCTLIGAYQTMLPTSLKVNNSKENYQLKNTYVEIINDQKKIDEYINNNKKAKKQIEILEELKECKKALKNLYPSESVKKLIAAGLLYITEENKARINPDNDIEDKNILTDDQEKVKDEILKSLNETNTFLLHGVTGSGKTEVYMHLCDEVIKNNKNVIMLVPEISLTTQMIDRFYKRFGSEVAIFHSNLSDGEKYDEYKKVLDGKVKIVVGTRSAIFVPFNNLGLIIIDEEHSQTYKQENSPRYHAIDIAKWRSEYYNCPLVLGSATPSLESMARAKKGVYKYLELKSRVGKSKLPKITLVDMHEEYKKRNMILSDTLQLKIMDRLNKKEQVMLLLNRRGYSTIITCECCGYTYKCPYCDISLTYHKSKNHLRCHYCGYTVIKSDICPNCNENNSLVNYGLGTEQVESFIKELYPSYNIVRMDKDTTVKKGSHESIIKGIEEGKYDIIIGTQMISKGLDFPNVTLVGVINADESLKVPDFRSGENTFSLLSQVSGRAGRGSKEGEVILQSFDPTNKTLNYILNNDYLGNYQYEMNIRKSLKYPPYYYLASIKVISKDYDEASTESRKIVNYIKNNIDSESICLGPTTANQFRLNNYYRFQIIIKYRKDEKLKEILKFIDNEYALNKTLNIELDIDPIRI